MDGRMDGRRVDETETNGRMDVRSGGGRMKRIETDAASIGETIRISKKAKMAEVAAVSAAAVAAVAESECFSTTTAISFKVSLP